MLRHLTRGGELGIFASACEMNNVLHSNRWFYYFAFTYRFFFWEGRAGEACVGVRMQT
ncbi:MAG TPA: hypothetical protein VJ023_06140 [Pyrinomonadaceae bacterium]|nr:hypothetical protein [Pyrinomonadaceae bacterium]